jgi:hypothetical protein
MRFLHDKCRGAAKDPETSQNIYIRKPCNRNDNKFSAVRYRTVRYRGTGHNIRFFLQNNFCSFSSVEANNIKSTTHFVFRRCKSFDVCQRVLNRQL